MLAQESPIQPYLTPQSSSVGNTASRRLDAAVAHRPPARNQARTRTNLSAVARSSTSTARQSGPPHPFTVSAPSLPSSSSVRIVPTNKEVDSQAFIIPYMVRLIIQGCYVYIDLCLD